jgi:hypothetical protein
MKLGNHTFRDFGGTNVVRGVDSRDYPAMADIPSTHTSGRSKGCKVFSELFYGGGRLGDHGLRLKTEVDSGKFYTTLRALMASYAPKHEIKEATCGWLIEEYTESDK